MAAALLALAAVVLLIVSHPLQHDQASPEQPHLATHSQEVQQARNPRAGRSPLASGVRKASTKLAGFSLFYEPDGQPVAGVRVVIRKKAPDGSRSETSHDLVTDPQGFVKVPPVLDPKGYEVLVRVSPFFALRGDLGAFLHRPKIGVPRPAKIRFRFEPEPRSGELLR